MISIQVTIAEAIAIANTASNDLHDRIVKTIEVALGVNQSRVITITGGLNLDNRIACIKAIRLATGWGLKETKDWTDPITGYYNCTGHRVPGGNDNTLTVKNSEAAESLLRELVGFGCEGFIS